MLSVFTRKEPQGNKKGAWNFLAVLALSPLLAHSDEVWRPLFDGKSLKGWHLQGPGGWRVITDSAAIVGVNSGSADYSHVVCDTVVIDFTIRLQFLGVKGNSGVYFHSQEGGPYGMGPIQFDLDAGGGEAKIAGYWEHTRQWVYKVPDSTLNRLWKLKAWNDLRLEAQGKSYRAFINGTKVAELVSEPLFPSSGHFGFQLHGGQACEFMYRQIEILDNNATVMIYQPNGLSGRLRNRVDLFAKGYSNSKVTSRIITPLGYGIDGRNFKLKMNSVELPLPIPGEKK